MDEHSIKVLEFHKIIDRLKELTVSPMGRELAEKLLPVSDMREVKYKLDETGEAVKILQEESTPPFGGLKDIRMALKKSEKGSMLLPDELLDVADLLRCSRNIKTFFYNIKDSKKKYMIIGEHINNLVILKQIEDKIFSSIDEQEICDGASDKLRSLRRRIRELQNEIKDKINTILKSPQNRKMLQELIVTQRNGRYVVPVKQEFRGSFPGIVHDQSSSGATLFIEPMSVVNINNYLQELKVQENKEVERILIELTKMVAEEAESISTNLKVLTKLDLIFAKARLAIQMDAVQPVINNENFINLKKARHPLLKGGVVPTDIHIGKDFKILVITGPNTGGKTVTLKTVGLLCLMAQSGLFIPAKWGSELPLFRNVYADIGDEQSIEQSLSSFSSHMTNIIKILKAVSDKDLVLLDELGAGTDPTEGAALAMAILDYLYNKNVLTIATTHYSELKTFAYTIEGIENASVEFDVETLKPTYKLMIGVPGKSNAFEISRRLGLFKEIIERAKNFLTEDNLKVEDLLKNIHEKHKAIQQDREQVREFRQEIQTLKKRYDYELKKLEHKKEKILREAREEAKDILKKAQNEAKAIIKELKSLYSRENEREKNKLIEEAQNRLKDSLSELEEQLHKPLLEKINKDESDELKQGDNVAIPSLNQTGVVVEKTKGDEIIIQVGMVKLTLPSSSVIKIKGKNDNENKEHFKYGKLVASKTQNISSELDVRGFSLQDATDKVDKYIDDAYLAGLSEVVVIHGKGTGILREGLHNYLKNNRLVKSFRSGKFGEGGEGVTFIQLNT
ncbi:MAG: mismatch repair protein MutS2 [Thermosediminibacterales bacterium]|nr:mismatch repair protein MutS2 [Thermosediminibacterales bacterium]MDK2835474.1 mismatch repair protein MutS2 [Thermosediminibacterales bacterium]